MSNSSLSDMWSGKLTPAVAEAFLANQTALETLMEKEDGKEEG